MVILLKIIENITKKTSLGPSVFSHSTFDIERKDFYLKNNRNHNLACSFYQIKDAYSIKRPCVIYLHCNSGSRIEALNYAEYILNHGLNYFSFDFSGCGNSEGEYISLGVHETKDLEAIVKCLKENFHVSNIVLWGRSMGAVTALKYASIDQSIKGIICDSPFSSLYKLALELGEEKTSVPGLFLPPILKLVEKTIKEKAGFEFKDLDLINCAQKSYIPCIFITSKEDNFVKPYHVETLYKIYGGRKKILYVEGDHNMERNPEFLEEITKHIINILNTTKKHMSAIPIQSNAPKNIQETKKIFYENPAKPLQGDRETNKKNYNIHNILETNKEIAKKIVLGQKKETFSRLDTEILYEDFPEVTNTSLPSAIKLKDKMQNFIHNSTFDDRSNKISQHNAYYEYDSGSTKHSNESYRILQNFNPKLSYSQPKSDLNYQKKDELIFSTHNFENFRESSNNYKIFSNQPQIKINNISYSNPIDLKKENFDLKEFHEKNSFHKSNGQHNRMQSNEQMYFLTSRNKQLL